MWHWWSNLGCGTPLAASGSPSISGSSLPNFPTETKRHTWLLGAYAPTNVSVADLEAKDEFYDQLHRTLRQVPPNGMLIFLGDFNANINPREEGCNRQVVGPYGCSRRPTDDNGQHLFELCSCFALVLTNTLHKVRTKDIMTYKTSPQTVSVDFWTTSLLGGPICRGSTRRGSLGGQIYSSIPQQIITWYGVC